MHLINPDIIASPDKVVKWIKKNNQFIKDLRYAKSQRKNLSIFKRFDNP
jgi:hypothetical protein